MPSPASFKVVNLILPGWTENLPTLLHSPCSRVLGKTIRVWIVSITGYGAHHDFAFTLSVLILIAFSQ
jgi:hypothetical protein